MRFPFLKELQRRRSNIAFFYGYEHLQKVRPGAFYDMKNLSSDKYPLLSVRPDRLMYYRGRRVDEDRVEELTLSPQTPLTAAAAVNGTVAMCSGDKVYYYGNIVADAVLDPAAANRKIIPFGRNFFVVPDGKYVLTDETGACGVRHAAFTQALLGAEVGYVNEDGLPVDPGAFLDSPPANPAENDFYTDISGDEYLLMRYTGGAWQRVSAVFPAIGHNMAGHYAAPGDKVTVTLSGGAPFTAEVTGAETGRMTLRYTAAPLTPGEYMVRVEKTMPPLDFAVEHENRVWGCRFGKNEKGEFVNEIYASALGDPTVWDRFSGISTDSYAVSLGCPGAFTGAAVTGGELIFFKENFLIRVCGASPQDYTVNVIPARGVAQGHGDTCVQLNEKIFYLSAAGVTVYDGALPYVISPEFSTHGFTDTLAFAYGGKYYLAAAENGVRRIYIYDTATGLWHVEDDDFNVRFFLLIDSAVFMLCRAGGSPPTYRFVVLNASEAGAARNIIGPAAQDLVCRFDPAPQKSWFAETGQLNGGGNTAILRMLVFRVELGENALFRAELRCDNAGRWIPLFAIRRLKTGAFSVPVNTPRCNSFSLRLSGEGDVTVYSVGLVSEKTGEVRVLVQ